jgi:hypothetical protein
MHRAQVKIMVRWKVNQIGQQSKTKGRRSDDQKTSDTKRPAPSSKRHESERTGAQVACKWLF